jgi:hypothetical protein
LLARIRAAHALAYAEPSLIEYPEGGVTRCYLTLDVVAERDAARRMRFAPAPGGTYPDPDGLIAAWQRYEAETWALLEAGELTGERRDCPAFHCFGDPAHPALALLSATLAAGAPAHVAELATILHDDHRPDRRAAAAMVLAYAGDGRAVVDALVPAFRDPDRVVRNDAMRVIAEVAAYHPAVDVPVEPVLDALELPATTDRNKAAAILAALVERPDGARLHDAVARRAGATLLAMLRLRQPNNHGFAYRILRAISGEHFGARDLAAWEAWLATRTQPNGGT